MFDRIIIYSWLINVLNYIYIYVILLQIVEQHVVRGVSYRLGRTCARGHVGLAVLAAAVFLQALPATIMYAPATPP